MSLDIPLGGTRLVADFSGALFWPDRGWLVVADLHLEKGSAFAARGRMLPPYDTGATLTRLEEACTRLRPRRVVCLGDSFHDRDAALRIGEADGRRIAALAAAHDWVWIVGNHDPTPPEQWGGSIAHALHEGALLFRHEAAPGPVAGEVSGHFHPKATVPTRGRRVGGRCFACDGHRLVLPAFGAYTGGLNVLDPALRGLFGRDLHVWLLSGDRVFRFPADRLAPDGAGGPVRRLRAAG